MREWCWLRGLVRWLRYGTRIAGHAYRLDETCDNATVDDDDFEDYDIYASEGCRRCGGEGIIVVCIDDMCRGAGECMHGDGEIACPDCGGI